MDRTDAGGIGRADLHIHTTHSDGRDTPRALVEHCSRLGSLDVIAVTDHDSIEGGLAAAEHAARTPGAPSVIVGEEVTSADGHILGLFLSSRVRPGLSAEATVAAIHEQGGIAIAAHPYWHVGGRRPHGVGGLLVSTEFDGVEVLNGGFTPSMFSANRRAALVNRAVGHASIGASDAHVKEAVGWGHTEFSGRGPAELRAAIAARTTVAARMPYGLLGVGRYLAWGIDRRPRRLVSGVA